MHCDGLLARRREGAPPRRQRLPLPAVRVRGHARRHGRGPRHAALRPPPRAESDRGGARLAVRLLHPRFCHVHVRPLAFERGATHPRRDRGGGRRQLVPMHRLPTHPRGFREIRRGRPRRRLLRRNPPGRSVALRGGRRRTRRRMRREARRRMRRMTDATPSPARRRVRSRRARRRGSRARPVAAEVPPPVARFAAPSPTSARPRASRSSPPNSNAASRANSSSPARTPPGTARRPSRAFSR